MFYMIKESTAITFSSKSRRPETPANVAKSSLPFCLHMAATLAILAAPFLSPALCLAEDQPTLRPDVPKLDTAPTAPGRSVLKGNIEHHAKVAAPPKSKPKRLNSRIVRPDIGSLNGYMKGKTDRSSPLQAGVQAPLQSGVQEPYTIDRSIGIIGIKFLKVGDRPPIVNRVFPGTPAYNTGFSVEDMIVAVDGVPTSGLTKDECYDLIVGTPNTPVTITLMHNGAFEKKSMTRMDFNEIPDPLVRRDYLHSL
jgi:hypothetical protein